MANASVILDIRANTQRALNDFKAFSSQLDNKFLISGLKLDVVRSALSQINREFQKAIGEQGLAAGSGLRAAENQAALLTQTFKGFSAEASLAITTDISAALNQVAATAGSTMDDVKRTIAATPFISATVPKELRENFSKELLGLQTDLRRAGVSDEFGNLAQQFLSGQITSLDLTNRGNALESTIGAKLLQQSGGYGGVITDPGQRAEVFRKAVLEDEAFRAQIRQYAERTAGFRITLEQLNASLFNPQVGVFGALRNVSIGLGESTNLFEETGVLVKKVFGPNGTFFAFWEGIGKAFGLTRDSALQGIIKGARFIGNQFDRLSAFFRGETFQDLLRPIRQLFVAIGNFFKSDTFSEIVNLAKNTFTKLLDFFKRLAGALSGVEELSFNPTQINESIRGIGESIREAIRKVGARIRGEDISEPTDVATSIFATLFEEIGSTIGTLISETLKTIVDQGPTIAKGLVTVVNKGIDGILSEVFGALSPVVKVLAGLLIPGKLGILARFSLGAGLAGGGPLGLAALGAMTFAPQIIGGGIKQARRAVRTGRSARRARNFILGRDGNGSRGPMWLQRLFSLGGIQGPASDISQSTGFHRQVIFYLSRLHRCLCGPITTPNIPPSGPGNGPGPSGPTQPGAPGASKAAQGSRPRSQGPGFFGFGRRRSQPIPNLGAYGRRDPGYLRRRMRRAYSSPIGPVPSTGQWGLDFANGGANLVPHRSAFSYSKRLSAIERYNRRAGMPGGFRSFRGGPINSARRLGAGAMRLGGRAGLVGLGAAGLIGLATMFGGDPAQAGTFKDQERLLKIQGASREEIAMQKRLFEEQRRQEAEQKKAGAGGAVLGGALEGALTGATIGSFLPGVGTAVGAGVGAVVGAAIPLLDKETREGIQDFGKGIKKTFDEKSKELSKSLSDGTTGLSKFFSDLPGKIASSMAGVDWGRVAFSAVPGVGLVDAIGALTGKFSIFDALKTGIDGLKTAVGEFWQKRPSWLGGQGGNFAGLNYTGPSLANEARNSGKQPLIVNSGEFVIPSNGFATVANLVEGRIRDNLESNSSSVSANFNVNINLSGGADIANLESSLREPVIKIINEAWQAATRSTVSRGAYV